MTKGLGNREKKQKKKEELKDYKLTEERRIPQRRRLSEENSH